MRYRGRTLAVGVLVVGLAAAGCSKTTNDSSGGKDTKAEKQVINVDTAGKAPVPAPEVPGAKKGGTITWLEEGAPEHLDPGQIYVSDALNISTHLLYRTLTTYIEPPKEGDPLQLVGDLATNAGETKDGGKTWTYHLRDGIKYEDGTAIKAQDISYGVARSFTKYGTQGPQYIQNALDPARAADPSKGYQGPYDGKETAPGVTTPDDKTIVFTFDKAHTELPYLLAFPNTTPIQKSKDTKEKYEDDWQVTGPYKRKEFVKDKSLTLERNPNWDAKTDPVRHQYVDGFKFDFTPDRATQTQRLKAGQGDDAFAVTASDVAAEEIGGWAADAELSKRAVTGATPFVEYVYINTTKVTDVDVRRAMNYAINKSAFIKAVGGSQLAAPASTILAPIVPGFQAYDAYPSSGNTGDVDKAKELLKGKTVPKLQYCFPNTPTQQKYATVNKEALERAGFEITLNPIDRKTYYTTVGKKDTSCALMRGGWGEDYPHGSSTLGVLMDGSLIVDAGNNNLSYFNEPSVNQKLKDLFAETDAAKAGKGYGDLDKEIMTKYAPLIPVYYTKGYHMRGAKVGGTFLSPLYDQCNLTNIFVNS